jgi:hypothetical protein
MARAKRAQTSTRQHKKNGGPLYTIPELFQELHIYTNALIGKLNELNELLGQLEEQVSPRKLRKSKRTHN